MTAGARGSARRRRTAVPESLLAGCARRCTAKGLLVQRRSRAGQAQLQVGVLCATKQSTHTGRGVSGKTLGRAARARQRSIAHLPLKQAHFFLKRGFTAVCFSL